MFRFQNLLSLAVALLAVSTSLSAQEKSGTLYWANGDILPGALQETDGNRLRWKSPLFREPLAIDTSALSAVRFDHANEVVTTDEAFRLVTRSGNVLHGSLADVTEKLVKLTSKRHGTMLVDRRQIRSLRRLDNPALIYLGPTGLNGWKTLSTKHKISDWETTDEGYLTTRRDKARLFRKLDIPGRAEIEIVLESKAALAFHLGLNSKFDDDVHLETWDDTLVALVEEEFVEIQRIKKKQKSLTLRLYWDEKTQQLSVYSEAGAELGSIRGTEKKRKSGESGILIENQGPGLTIKSVRVSQWDGSKPRPVEKGQNRVHLIDGSLLYGTISTLEGDKIRLTKEDEEEVDIPLEKIDSIYLADDLKTIPDGTTSVFWLDGTRITGELSEIMKGKIGVRTNYSDEPIVSDLDKSNRLLFTPAKPAGKAAAANKAIDRLYSSGGTLHGTLVGNGDDVGTAALRWRPTGGLNSSPLAPNCDARFVRGKRTEEVTYDKKKYSDLLYLVSGDVVPCHVDSIDEDALRITTAFAKAGKIPHDNVKAIELSNTDALETSGFDDPGWKVIGSTKLIKREAEAVTFESAGRITHKNIFSGGTATFNMKWDSQSYISTNLRLFTTGSGNSGGVNVMLMMRGNQVWASEANAFRGRTQSTNVPKPEAKIRLMLKDNKLSLFVNDKLLHTTNRVKRRGSGMTIQVTQNQLLRGGAGKSKFVLTDFQSRRGTAVRQFVDSEAKERALTITRFRRDKPSTHVLIAPNGDLLRGNLRMVTQNQIRFSSRLEDFRFDRERVSAIIWLHPKGEKEQPTPDEDAPIVRTVLDGGLGLVLIPERMTEEKLIGRSPVLGECSVPVTAIRELFAGKYEKKGEKFAYADWSITPGMEPRWDMEDVGGGDPAMQLIGKKAGDFKLARLKGDDKFVLSENEGKIVVLDFWATWCGPCVRAMPEYLAALEGLPADKVQFVAVNQGEAKEVVNAFLKRRDDWEIPVVAMDEDMQVAQSFAVSGIPHTVVIGTDGSVEWVHTGFEPGGGKTLRDNIDKMLDGTWERPSLASESINGTDSKLVGTKVRDLSIKLLNDTEFTLGAKKDQVVVLDFWATWCGPCVRALPDYLAVMEELDSKDVLFIAVNQAEKKDLIKTFMERRELKMTVGMDPDGKIAKMFDVEGIPQTVVIGPDGKIEWLHVGYKTGVAEALRDTVKKLLPAKAE